MYHMQFINKNTLETYINYRNIVFHSMYNKNLNVGKYLYPSIHIHIDNKKLRL